MTRSRYVDDRAPTVSDLVARFQLRRRASTEAFRIGVRLARTGLVNIAGLDPDRVRAEVRDPNPLRVELCVERGSLVGRCPCPAAAHSVCRHQVAVAHALWVGRRRYRHPTATDETQPPDARRPRLLLVHGERVATAEPGGERSRK